MWLFVFRKESRWDSGDQQVSLVTQLGATYGRKKGNGWILSISICTRTSVLTCKNITTAEIHFLRMSESVDFGKFIPHRVIAERDGNWLGKGVKTLPQPAKPINKLLIDNTQKGVFLLLF